ncbi:MAG: choice-of-anchor tandem repeat NxxGxxAF-containing protein [Planctomycetota bacterium]
MGWRGVRAFGGGGFAAIAVAGSVAFSGTVHAQSGLEVMLVEGLAPPEGNGTLAGFTQPSLTASGEITFEGVLTGTTGGLNDNRGIYRTSGGTLTTLIRERLSTPGLTGISSLRSQAVDTAGGASYVYDASPTLGSPGSPVALRDQQTADGTVFRLATDGETIAGVGTVTDVDPFSAFPRSDASGRTIYVLGVDDGGTARQALFLASGGTRVPVLVTGDPLLSGPGSVQGFISLRLDEHGGALLQLGFSGTAGGVSDNSGLYRRDNAGTLTEAARENQLVPDGNGRLGTFSPISINATGQALFTSFLRDTLGDTLDDRAVYLADPGGLIRVVRENQTLPELDHAVADFSDATLNDAGRVALGLELRDTPNGFDDDRVVYLTDPLALGGSTTGVVLAREGAAAPDGNGVFSAFSVAGLNERDTVLLDASLRSTANGFDDDRGLYLANEFDVVNIVREGDPLLNATVATIGVVASSTLSPLNDANQVGFEVTLDDGRDVLLRYTPPTRRWTNAGSGSWSSDSFWSGAVEPTSFNPTVIAPSVASVVTGPFVNVVVDTFTLGGGNGTATLSLTGTTDGDVRALGVATIAGNGVLELANGRTLVAPDLQNTGVIRAASGSVQDGGTVGATVSNAGRVEAIGGSLTFDGFVSNLAGTGLITARDGTLRFDGGLFNAGAVALSFGTTDVFGQIDNAAGGVIVVSGNSNATFYDDVGNAGAINVSTGSTAVFFGELAGLGVGGAGTVFLEGDTRPGFSPGDMEFGGDVVIGFLHALELELGGTGVGAFDRLLIDGAASLAGSLSVAPLGGFSFSAGDAFEVLSADGGVSGTFADVALPALEEGLLWDVQYTSDAVTLAVVGTGLPGDYNASGQVEQGDLNLVLNNWGLDTGGVAPPGWINFDPASGQIDQADLNLVLNNWGSSATPSFEGFAVPEPGVAALLAGLVCLVRRHRD